LVLNASDGTAPEPRHDLAGDASIRIKRWSGGGSATTRPSRHPLRDRLATSGDALRRASPSRHPFGQRLGLRRKRAHGLLSGMLRKLLSDRILFTAGVVLISLYVVFPLDHDNWNEVELFIVSVPLFVGVGLVAWSAFNLIEAAALRLRSVP
jgi:hypothetical protein